MIKNIPPKEAFKALIKDEAILIDVREPTEFSDEHIAYAMSMPLSILKNEFKNLNIPKDKKILFQCLKGSRSQQACSVVLDIEGMANDIYSIQGGIDGWKEAELPVITNGKPKGLPIHRQVQIIIGGLVALLVIIGLSGTKTAITLAGILGAALCFAGLTGWCGLAFVLSKMPWNKP